MSETASPANTTAPDVYVEVALPVPLRRRFTYRVPKELVGSLEAGSRVAVPFGRRTHVGIVLGASSGVPEGVRQVHDIAGLLEPEPLFNEELLVFLRRAADYYLHPLGEVLRAASPAMPREVLTELRERDSQGRSIKGAALRTRTVTLVRLLTPPPETLRLGPKQRALLTLLEVGGELSLEEIRQRVSNPRAVISGLVRKGLVALRTEEVVADPFFSDVVERDTPKTLNNAQERATDAIVASVRDEAHAAFLLHGVTASGKTEVYLRVIEEARARGKGALLLVPEIALTPQLVARFRARFGDGIAVLHSGRGDRERNDAWRGLRRGQLRIAVGARSALFAPVPDLGVIIVDEEHDPSFKQEEGFRYHARDMALLRASLSSATCVLGSATPSIETYHLAEKGKLQLLVLPERATPQRLPSVEIVNLATHRSGPSGHPLLSAPLHRALERCLEERGQAILFLNRRGFAPSVRCESCGHVMECPACSVALTEHRRAGILRCHYCDFAKAFSEPCPECDSMSFERVGLGTERLEDVLAEVFPNARVARLDRDTAVGAGTERVLDRLRRHEVDILVGTQMITKGHDLPGVTLVGVILADQSLMFPDFRAAERTFQLLAQVAGRAGRGEQGGRVIFQTFQPNHPAVKLAATHDYDGFYRAELGARRDVGYTPFSRLVCVRVDAGDEPTAAKTARSLAAVAEAHPAVLRGHVQVLGPAPAPIVRLRGRWRYRFMLRSADRSLLRKVAIAVAQKLDAGVRPARATLDVDPVSML